MTLFLLGNKPIANGQKPKNDMVMMADIFESSPDSELCLLMLLEKPAFLKDDENSIFAPFGILIHTVVGSEKNQTYYNVQDI